MRPLGRRATAAEGEDEAENARQAEYFEAEPEREGGQDEATSFASLHLSRALLKAVSDLGYNEPTPIQVHHALGAPPTPATSPSLLARCPSCGTEAVHSLDSGWPRRVWERRHRVGQDGSLLAACAGAPAVPAQAHCSHSRAGTIQRRSCHSPWPRLSPHACLVCCALPDCDTNPRVGHTNLLHVPAAGQVLGHSRCTGKPKWQPRPTHQLARSLVC